MKYALGVLALCVLLGFVWFSRAPRYRPLTMALEANAATPESQREGPFEGWSPTSKRAPVFLEVGKLDVRPNRVYSSFDAAGRLALGVELQKSEGGRVFEITARHVGRELVILFDGRVLTLGTIEAGLPRSFLVATDLTPAEANELRSRLRE